MFCCCSLDCCGYYCSISLAQKIRNIMYLECFYIANLDLDGTSQLSYSEILSYEDQPISTLSQSPCESRDTRHHGPCHQETGIVQSLSRPCVESILEAETVFTNRGFEDSYATHSSSVWSPEASCWLSFLFGKFFLSLFQYCAFTPPPIG